MERILVLNQYFPPDTAATAKMAAALAEFLGRHFHVTVVAGRPSYSPTQRHPFYLWRREDLGRVKVVRVGSTALPRHRMCWRMSNYLSYLTLALARALTISADAVIAMTDPPLVCLVGALIARLRGCPFIYNIRDLHPDMALAAGLIAPGAWTERWERLHRWALKQADWIVVLGEDMKERMRAKGVPAEKIVVVRDGFFGDIVALPCSHPVVQQLRCGFGFVAMHAGNIGFYGAWETLVTAARQVQDEAIGLVFVGDGAYKDRLMRCANGARNVRLLPFRPNSELPFVLTAPDIHIVTIKRGMEGMVVPSKLYPILAVGKAILVVASEKSDAARIVAQAQCGLIADPDDPAAVTDALRWAFRNPDALQAMGRRAKAIAPEFAAECQFQRFAALVHRALRWEAQCSKLVGG